MKDAFDYDAAPKEVYAGPCPACGIQSNYVSAQPAVDRYGFGITVSVCNLCSMCWLRRRMTPAAYADFYASGAYRRLVSAFHGRPINDETIRPEQREYARKLGAVLRPWLRDSPGGHLLDVGGATGVVAADLCDGWMQGTVLDPAPNVTDAALEVIRGTAEGADLAGRSWDVILLCQSIDHLLDPAAVLTKLREHLALDGVLWVDALDFEITRELKIDHPHNFTERSLERLLDRTGWATLARARWNRHVGFVCTA